MQGKLLLLLLGLSMQLKFVLRKERQFSLREELNPQNQVFSLRLDSAGILSV